VTAAAWARIYHHELLDQLETEANEGWPDLPWPPEIPADRQIATLEQMLTLLGDILEEADRGYGKAAV
jgi:hypothetical protein